ncbi:MAG: hypothetical protein K9I70_02715 [Chitinophagaceae bacterium]|jgi:hypothetical protein|nr:hypothetical protein [Chitinophagaceae bacterium]
MSTNSPKKPASVGCLGLIAIITVMFFIFKGCSGDTSSATTEEENAPPTCSYQIAKQYVMRKLKYPDEAVFPLSPDSREWAEKPNVQIISTFTSKNGFGVKVQMAFNCTLQYLGGNECDGANYKLIDLNVVER